MKQIFTKLFKKNKSFTLYGTIIEGGSATGNATARFVDFGDGKYGPVCYILPFKGKVGERVRITFEML